MPMQKDVKNIVIIFSVIIVLITSIFSYTMYSMQKDYNEQILSMENDLIQSLALIKQGLEEHINDVATNISVKLNIVENNLNNYRVESEKELDAINDLIIEIEEQSDIRLNELKEEVSNIKVQSEDFSSIVEDVLESVVSVGTDKGLGSGAIIDDDGFIVTNHHVVQGARMIRVLTYNGKVYDGEVIGFDPDVDVAVIKINAPQLLELRYDDSEDVKVGEKVIALGSPAGLSFTVTEGIVSGVEREGPNDLPIFIQTDVPINPGNSGGPLVNTNSKIIGLNNFKIGGFEGLGFAIESNTVKEITDEIIDNYNELNSE